MKKWMKAAAGIGLALAMTVLPLGMAHAADSNPGILMGTSGLKGAGVSHVYYGAHDGAPIETRVLSTSDGDDSGTKGLLLLSEDSLEKVAFNPNGNTPTSNVWAGSPAQTWCNTVYNGFAAEEKSAVLATTKTETSTYIINSWSYNPCSLNAEHLYFLSVKEAVKEEYGFEATGTTDTSREAKVKGATANSPWWLRSAYTNNSNTAGAVDRHGDLAAGDVDDGLGGRPAFRINLTSVLFASAAVGGKKGAVGALSEVGTNGTDDWKLTLKDTSRNFAVSNQAAKTVPAGQTLTLNYTGAMAGSNEYVSAMLLDHSGKPAYYGRMKQVSAVADASGVLPVTLPAGLTPGEYTLQVMSEQYNGDKETDIASAPVDIPVKVVDQENVQPPVEDGKIEGVPVKVTQGERVTFTAAGAGMENTTPIAGDGRWRPISWSVNPSGDFANGYTQSFETTGMSPGEHTLTVTYAKERHDGTAWVDTNERKTQSFTFTLLAAPSQGGEEPQAPPSDDPAAPGGAVTPTDEPGGDNPTTGDPISIAWLAITAAGALGVGAAAEKKRKRS